MSKEKNAPAIILGWLASLKLTLFLFFALAAACLIGTLLPQGIGPADLQAHFSPASASIISLLGLSNLYHTAWFRVLLLLLCTNLLACTIDRLPKTVRLIQRREDPFTAQKISKFSSSRTIATRRSPGEARKILGETVSEFFGPAFEIQASDPYCAVSEKGRWSRLMVYGVHLSVIVVLMGALLGSLTGFKGNMNLSEGDASNEVVLADGENFIKIPFQVRCDKFEVSFYDTGAPKEFKSDLTLIEGGKEVLKQPIVVNDPLTYQGITFYQASYGTTLKSAELELKDRETGKTVTVTAPMRQPTPIPGTHDNLEIVQYQDNFMRVGPALGVMLGKEGQQGLSGSWILVDRPDFHGNRLQNYQVRVVKADKVYFTGLQVKKDPGVWFVWLGFSAMIIGIGLTFYTSHTKVWMCTEPDKKEKGINVTVAGRCSRNASGFGEKFDAFCARLEQRLKPEKK